MPEERWEWIVFWLGIGVAAALIALIVLGGSPQTPVGRAEAAPSPPPTATVITPAAVPTTTAKPKPRQAAAAVTLRLTARNDTWLSVRSASSGRRVLYQGTLAAGAARTFSGTSFEVRFGAAANVEATLNGKALPLPGGTYSVTVGKQGLGARTA